MLIHIGAIDMMPGVAKSTVGVVRVVHLAIRTTAFYIFTCPWTT